MLQHMKINRDKSCLVLPLNNEAKPVEVHFRAGSTKEWTLFVRLDFENPAYTMYPDFSRFLEDEEELEITAEYSFEAAAKPEPDYALPWRPKLRFSPAFGWNNAPNGCCYYRGEYHLFFQHNPAGSA